MFWTLLPVYNMVLIALSEDGDEFTGSVWPSDPSFEGFQMIWTGEYWHLANFWHQFGNSIYIGLGHDGADRADRLAGQLRDGPHGAAQGVG